jgi:hypothetical protein
MLTSEAIRLALLPELNHEPMDVTLGHAELLVKIQPVRQPRPLPVVLSCDEVGQASARYSGSGEWPAQYHDSAAAAGHEVHLMRRDGQQVDQP